MTDKPDFRLAAKVVPAGLNVHHSPAGAIFDALPRGMKVTILRYEQRPQCLWAYIHAPARHEHGWVRADYLALDPPAELPRIVLPEVEPIISLRVKKWLVAAAVAVAVLVSAYSCSALARELPDHALTPGVAVKMTLRKLCSTKWGTDARKVTASMKREVFASYGLSGNGDPSCTSPRHFEVDHLISRELGGADDVRNLWPQCYGGKWNAVDKDRVENRLHKEVCARRLSLAAAQKEIRADWRVPFRRYFGNLGE